MRWGYPYAWFFLLGAIPLIIFLHSLKPQGRQVRTTTLFLWERVLRERPLGKRLGWLFRKNLLLILQLLIASILIAALADPLLTYYGARSGDTVVVVDLSASMKARGVSLSRFEAARREFFSLVEGLSSGQKMMVIGAGPYPRILAPFTGERGRLREVGRSLVATDAPGRVKEAVLFAHAFLKRGSPDHVVVITDGAFEGAGSFSKQNAQLRFIRVEGGKENVGIVGFEVRRHLDQPSNLEMMVHIKNFTPRPVRAPLTLSQAGKVLAKEQVDVEADGRRVLIYPFEGSLTGALEARLEIQDEFATDNRAYLAVADAPPVKLLYVGPGNLFLSNLLRFFPHVQMTAMERWEPDLAAGQRQFDIVLFDRVPAPPLTQGNFILINTVAPNLPIQSQGRTQRPRLVGSVARHPVTQGLELGDLHVQEALRLVSKDGGMPLVHSTSGPLIFAVEKGKLRILLIGFDLLASDLPLRVAFPLLFHNAIEWFQPNRLEFPAQSVQSGSPYALRLSAVDDKVEVRTPSNRKENLRAVAVPLMFADTSEAGFYSFKSASRDGQFAVNLLDETESQIVPQAQVAPAKTPTRESEQTETVKAGFSIWPSLLVGVLLLLALEAYLAFRGGVSRYSLAARLAASAALILAIVNPSFFQAAKALDVVLAVDVSRSVGQEGREKARQLLEAASRIKNLETRTGLLFFGQQPEWEFLPRAEFPAVDVSPRLNREETNIEAALQAALAQIGEGREGKIVLISDGNENRGEISRVFPLLRAQGAQVWALPASLSRGKNEIFLSDLVVPQQVDSAESFEIKGVIESRNDARARVKLLRDGIAQKEQEIRLKGGSNWVNFKDSLKERGSHSYELLVESSEDTLPENNLLQAVVEVKGPPRILILSSQRDNQRFLSRVLQVQGYSVVDAAPDSHPLTLPELSSFDLLVLDNVPAYQLSQAKMESIEKFVRDLGGGLFVIGGSQSYGAGGYYRTPLERILPVDMRPPARLDIPHVALLFVIDKSGSMGGGPEGGTKLDLAKAAAVAAADIMNPTDQIGILSFDAAWDWVLPFRPVGRGEWISERLASLQSDGGTDLYKAMIEAHRSFSGKEAAIKHVLVLSDGLTDKMDFHSLVQRMVGDGITVSTVSVGPDADVKLMAEIAKDGRGRGYVTVDPQSIPQIFTAETLLISRDLLVEKTVQPSVVAPVGPLKGLRYGHLPSLRGYVLTYPKPRAELLMAADKDPLLVSWRHGLGNVIAFTSDLSGRWGREWVAWHGLPQWAGQVARYTMRKILETRMRSNFKADGEGITVVTDLSSKEGNFLNHLKLRGNLTTSGKSTTPAVFQQIAPGRYKTKFPGVERGIHLLTIYADGKPSEAPLSLATVPYIAPYPKEYRELTPNTALLNRLAEETGGEMLDLDKVEENIKRLYTPSPGKGRRAQEIWWPLAGMGLLFFLADLILRNWPAHSTLS